MDITGLFILETVNKTAYTWKKKKYTDKLTKKKGKTRTLHGNSELINLPPATPPPPGKSCSLTFLVSKHRPTEVV